MLDANIQRAIGVVLQLVAITDCVTINRVCNLEPACVVHGDGPERIDWRKFVLPEVKNIAVFTGERLALGITDVQRIDRIFRLIGTKPDQRDDCPFEVIVSVDAHRIRLHLSLIRDSGEQWHLGVHRFESEC